MKRILFSIIFAGCSILPAISIAQTGTDPNPVQSAKNRQKAADAAKSGAFDGPQSATPPVNSKNGPVTVSGLSTAVPSINPSGRKFIDPANMDLSIKPGDNFYLYANGAWIKKTPIPASKTRWGSFDALAEESSQALKGLLEEAAKNPKARADGQEKSEFGDLMKDTRRR